MSLLRSLSVLLSVSAILFGLSACSLMPGFTPSYQNNDGAPNRQLADCQIENAVPRVEPKSQRGNPATYTVRGKTYRVLDSAQNYRERGVASWYGTAFHGNQTSNGERYDMYTMTAAHKHLPLPSFVEVTNLQNSRRVIVRVNDRGPFVTGRIIDLSYAAATKIGMLKQGTADVEIRVLDPATFKFSDWSGDERCLGKNAATTSHSFPASSRGPASRSTAELTVQSEPVNPTIITDADEARLKNNDASASRQSVLTEPPRSETRQWIGTYLQLAAYSQQRVAEKELVALERELTLKNIPYSAGLFPYFPSDASGAWYRLRIGPFESRAKAEEYKAKAMFSRFGKIFVVEQ